MAVQLDGSPADGIPQVRPESISPAPRSDAPSASGSERGRKLRVIGRGPLARMLNTAVARALRVEIAEIDAERVLAVQDVVRREFAEMMRVNGERIRGIPKSEFMRELERSRDRIVGARDRARAELEDLSHRADMLAAMRDRVAENEHLEHTEITERAEDLRNELAARFRDVLDQNGTSSSSELSDALANVGEEVLRAAAQRAADSRARRAEEQLGQFQRRIAKLTNSLEKTESALARLAQLKNVDGGIASIYRTVQGLEADVEGFAVKRAMLVEIFEANLVLQKSAG